MKFPTNNPGTWFLFDEARPELGRVCVRLCNGGALEEIDAKTVTMEAEYRKGQRYQYPKVDDKRRSELVWDYSIVDWEGVEDEQGTPIPCTKDNKALLMRNSMEFAVFVGDCLEKLNVASKEWRTRAEKN